MRINIDHLTEPELIDLNRRVIERLRIMSQMKAHVTMMEFQLGERVWFENDRRERIEGILIRYNKKSVTVITDAGARWTVSPGFLRRAASKSSNSGTPRTIEAEDLSDRYRSHG